MPKMPRDISGHELVKKLEKLGYKVVRQTGSHMTRTEALMSLEPGMAGSDQASKRRS